MASDFTAGDLLAEAGARADARLIALALAAGHATLDVPRLPAITCLDTGDELAPPGEKTDPHRIPASNGAMIAALAAPLTRTIDLPPPVPDDRAALVRALHEAERHDVIVTSGGASVGEHDHLQDAVREWGGEITFWRVAIKPGKPLLIAQKSGCLLIGLPGNPVSGYVTALLFLIPVLRALAGCNAPLPPTRRAVMACDLPAGGGRREFLRMRMTPAGLVRADSQDSAALRSLAMADALLDRAAHAPPAAIGDECSIIDLTGSPFA
jgi:molybdopterin molybdotransferase